MTILESSNKLIEWFSKNDSFNIRDNFVSLFPEYDKDRSEIDKTLLKASLSCALIELEKRDLLRSIEIGRQRCYILVRPMESIEQNVSISYNTAIAISEIIKQASERYDNKSFTPDSTNITEKDIRMALTILVESAKISTNERQSEKTN
jgi:hypothetical protein